MTELPAEDPCAGSDLVGHVDGGAFGEIGCHLGKWGQHRSSLPLTMHAPPRPAPPRLTVNLPAPTATPSRLPSALRGSIAAFAT
ncbi:hypothetical protein [Micromonospora aurantiaca (nom. illeg.)]|uniref:hypothetical protein n=1 Tax=Micromonospora aurantiaca (nom. illeg.) TaxID=47850 RepID=UPI0034348F7C